MKKILILFLILIPIALAQNYTLTTGQLPVNYTLDLEISNLALNDTIYIGSDDWITLETNTYSLGENDTNYSFNPILSIPLIEEGNYTKKIYYNATGFSNFEIPIDIEIINNTETYQLFLENEGKEYLDCIIRKMRENTEENNSTKRLKAEYECRYEVTNNPNGTLVIQRETITEEKPVIDTESKTKIETIETATTGINTEITNLKTEVSNLKTELLNRINSMEENISQTKASETTNTGINWTVLAIITGIAIVILGTAAYIISKKRQNQNNNTGFQAQEPTPVIKKPQEKTKKTPKEPKKEKKQFFKKKEKPDFDRLI